jgi:hypothetical protein
MVEIDPGLDTRLRAFFDHYESEAMPPRLAMFDQEAKPKRRAAVQFAVGALGVAVIAGAAAVFAIELGNHNGSGSPTPGGRSTGTNTPDPALPVLGSNLPTSAHVLVPATYGTGSAVLSTFVVDAHQLVDVQAVCIGGDTSHFQATFSAGGSASPSLFGCSDNRADGSEFFIQRGFSTGPTTIDIQADSATSWELFVYETPSPPGLPILGGSPPLPANAQVLVPETFGNGSGTLPAFTPTEPYYIQMACNGVGPFDLESADGSVSVRQFDCGEGPSTETIFPPKNQVLGQPLSVSVDAPNMTWEILIVESDKPTPTASTQPSGFTVPPGAKILVPVTQGTGPTTLPAFAPNGSSYFFIAACSGSGGLSVLQSGTVLGGESPCAGLNSTAGNEFVDRVPGQPESLSIDVGPSTTWKILIYEMSSSS